jgi:hypothetical protein
MSESLKALVEEQDELFSEMRRVVERLAEINTSLDAIGSGDHHIDLFYSACKHRHAFADQGVEDHTQCMVAKCVLGEYESIVGGLVNMAKHIPLFEKAVMESVPYIMISKFAKRDDKEN